MMIYFSNRPVGKNIRRLRRKKGMSLLTLARQADVPWRILLALESRILRDIHHDHLLRLCRALNTTQTELFTKL